MLKLVCDALEPNQPGFNIDNPKISQIVQRIEMLDGLRHSEVLIMDGDCQGLLITGGHSGNYLCERKLGDEHYTLLNNGSSVSDETVPLLTNGSPDFPMSIVVGKQQVLAAARHFFKTQELDPHQTWK
jgi:hypothetical protein